RWQAPRSLIEVLNHAALLPIFRLSKARGGRIPDAVCNRRATTERRKSGATRRARAFWAVWQRCSLLTGRFGHARRSRLAIQPNALPRGMAEYFNRLLNGQHALAGHRRLHFRCRRWIGQLVTAP